MLSRISTSAFLFFCLSQSAWAASDSHVDISLISNNQAIFSDLVEDLGAALSYKALSPAEPLGITGFDIGFEISGTKMESNALEQATADSAPSTLYIPKIHVHKGLPFGIDVGAFMTSIPDSNMKVMGGELKYAFVSGNTLIPAFAVRGTYSQLSGVDKFSLTSTGLELSVSKGFAMFTPYAGVGTVRVEGDSDFSSLSSESLTQKKVFMGVNFNMGLLNFAAETEQTGDNASTSAKIGVRF